MSEMIQAGFDYAALPADVAVKAQIAASNIKLRLKRTVEDIIEIGRELTAVKAELPHGQFLPWIAAEFEMSEQMAQEFMRVFKRFGSEKQEILVFKPSVLYALAAPSTPTEVIDKAVEKGKDTTVANVKDWKAELEAERQARLKAEQQSQEWKDQWKTERDTKRELEQQIDLLQKQPKPEPEIQVVEKVPDDYEVAKTQAAELTAQTEELQRQLQSLQKQQTKLVNEQVKAKLRERQSELDKLEADKQTIEEIVARKKAYLDSLSSEVKRVEAHRETINGSRLELIGLAAFLNDVEPISDKDTIDRWLALAQMHEEAATTIRLVFGEKRPALN